MQVLFYHLKSIGCFQVTSVSSKFAGSNFEVAQVMYTYAKLWQLASASAAHASSIICAATHTPTLVLSHTMAFTGGSCWMLCCASNDPMFLSRTTLTCAMQVHIHGCLGQAGWCVQAGNTAHASVRTLPNHAYESAVIQALFAYL